MKKLISKLEDIAFSVISHLPIIPDSLATWSSKYLDRRIAELRHETIRQQWDKASLNQQRNQIHDWQQNREKAPSED